MPRPPLTEEQRREIRRTIRQAAAKLYAENGLKNISARAVAETAGVSVGTLYAHFGNLTGLMQSLWQEPLLRLLEDLDESARNLADPGERLGVLLNTYATFAHEQQAVYRAAFLHIRPDAQEKPRPVKPDEDRFFFLLKHTITEGQTQGRFRSGDPNILTQTLWAGLHGAIALPLNMDRLALDPPELMCRHMIQALQTWIASPR